MGLLHFAEYKSRSRTVGDLRGDRFRQVTVFPFPGARARRCRRGRRLCRVQASTRADYRTDHSPARGDDIGDEYVISLSLKMIMVINK